MQNFYWSYGNYLKEVKHSKVQAVTYNWIGNIISHGDAISQSSTCFRVYSSVAFSIVPPFWILALSVTYCSDMFNSFLTFHLDMWCQHTNNTIIYIKGLELS